MNNGTYFLKAAFFSLTGLRVTTGYILPIGNSVLLPCIQTILKAKMVFKNSKILI